MYLSLTRNRIPIFLLHRAASPEFGIHGYCIDEVLEFVNQVKARHIDVISLDEAVRHSESGTVPRRPAVAFTADDGYWDQASILGQSFARHEIPLTLFVITDFVDGRSWTWDAKVAHAFNKTSVSEVELKLGQLNLAFDLCTQVKKTHARREFQLICKSLKTEILDATIDALYHKLDVQLPESPPQQFAPMNWSQARTLEERGITFAPHSCSHRVMSRLDEDEIVRELSESWGRLTQELSTPLKVIAWPIGQNADFGQREVRIAKELGYRAAVAARHRVSVLDSSADHFLLDRVGFSIDDQAQESWQMMTGIKRLNAPYQSDNQRIPRVTDMDTMAGAPELIRPNYRRRARLMSIMYSLMGRTGIINRLASISLESVDRLVFVCQGNICRSPYAAALAREHSIKTLSCGITANDIAGADNVAARVAFGRGIDLSDHVSTNIHNIDLAPGDLLLGMEPAHLPSLKGFSERTGVPAALLGMWADKPKPLIEDPFGLSSVAFERVFKQIEDSVSGLIDDLSG